MLLDETHCVGYKRDSGDGPMQLCLSYVILGLLASAFVTSIPIETHSMNRDTSSSIAADQKIASLVVDLIAVLNKKKGAKAKVFLK